MKGATMDMTTLDEAIGVLNSIYQHRKSKPTVPSDELYYELVLKYFQGVRTAADEGRYLGAFSVAMPTEILHAMGIVPMSIEGLPMMIALTLNKYEEGFSAARGYGMTPEICSSHRYAVGTSLLGWLPRPDFILWSNMVCDNTVKCGDFFVERYNSPPFFLDRPYRYTERETQYLIQELEDMVHFLEEHTHQKMDLDRLSEVVEYSRQGVELQREIYELRKAVPEPARNRLFVQIFTMITLYGGSPDCLPYLKAIRDELKERVENKQGYAPKENFRLLSLFVPNMGSMKLLDWMEREHGAVIVADPYISHWGEGEMDPSKPMESIARKLFDIPACRLMHGPMGDGVVQDSVKDAIDYKAEGAVYFAHTGCRQACATIRTVKDALKEQAGIPTVVIDIDILDPTFTSEDEMKGKLEAFFELLEDRK